MYIYVPVHLPVTFKICNKSGRSPVDNGIPVLNNNYVHVCYTCVIIDYNYN